MYLVLRAVTFCKVLRGNPSFIYSLTHSCIHSFIQKYLLSTRYVPSIWFMALGIHWWIKQPKPTCSLPTMVCPQSKSLSVFPASSTIYTVLPFQKHTAPHIITCISQNISSACLSGVRLPSVQQLGWELRSRLSNWASRLGPYPACAGLCTDQRVPINSQTPCVNTGGQLLSIWGA